MPKIEEDGKSWLRRPKLYKAVVEPYKKKKKKFYYVAIIIQVLHYIDKSVNAVWENYHHFILWSKLESFSNVTASGACI